MGRYIGTAELYAYLFGTTGTIVAGGGTITPTQQSLMGSAINYAEDIINKYTRRNFAGTAGTHYVNRYEQDHVRRQALYIESDLHTLTALQNGDGQDIPVGSVWLEPRNEGPPYRILRLKSQFVFVWNTDSDVIISGTWGYSREAPEDIKQATLRYAAWLYRQKDIAGVPEASGFPEGGEAQFSRGIPDDIRYILNPYRSRSGGVV